MSLFIHFSICAIYLTLSSLYYRYLILRWNPRSIILILRGFVRQFVHFKYYFVDLYQKSSKCVCSELELARSLAASILNLFRASRALGTTGCLEFLELDIMNISFSFFSLNREEIGFLDPSIV